MLEKHGEFGRKYLFCEKCIGWAKMELMKLREQSQPTGTLEQPISSQQPGAAQQPSPQQQYSPISETGGNRNTPVPFNMPHITTHDLIGARLANPHDSPIHLNGNFIRLESFRKYIASMCM